MQNPRWSTLAIAFSFAISLAGCGEAMAVRTGTWAGSGDLAVLGGGASREIDGWVVGFAVAKAKGADPRTLYAWVCAQPEMGKDTDKHSSRSDTECHTDGKVGVIGDSLRSGDHEFRIRAEITYDRGTSRIDDVVTLDDKSADVGLGRVFLIDLRNAKRSRQLAVEIPTAAIASEPPDKSEVDAAAYARTLHALLVANPDVKAFFAGQ